MVFAIGDELLAEELNDLKMTFTIQLFTSGGTWVKPDGLSRLWVRVIGAGGGSGGVAATGGAAHTGAGGGGGGGYSEKLFLASELANSESVDIGAGGAAGASGANNGGTGGSSVFATGKAYAMTCTGGIGGQGGSGTGTYLGGAGGTGSGGTINLRGGQGGHAYVTTVPTTTLVNWGGFSKLSGQAPNISASGSGNAGELYGGGASGAFNNVSQSARAGSAGAAGLVVVWNCF